MELPVNSLSRDELAAARLRALFERRGFRRARVDKFEDYALYVENKNFINAESVITFMDLNGKLLALKPDVTLSIVKRVPKKELAAPEKLYYSDEVFRLSGKDAVYKVTHQIGMEIIGKPDAFSNIEAEELALLSLESIDESFVLDVSHLGFISGLLDEAGLAESARRQVLSALHRRSRHDVAASLEPARASGECVNRALALCDLRGSFAAAHKKAEGLIANDAMRAAHAELGLLLKSLGRSGVSNRLNLDFSVVNDLDYYNGLVFSGYLEGVPKVVLTGGRYDNLMKKMNNRNSAIGFAIILDDLSAYLNSDHLKRHDFDVLLTYGGGCDYALLLKEANALIAGGESVRLENESTDLKSAGFTFKRRCRFDGGIVKEAAQC